MVDSQARATTLELTRRPAIGRRGVVAGKMPVAVAAGRDVLAHGGNAIDAAVTTAFAMGVAEPWMNGIGGGGYMVVWLAGERRALTIEYPMVAPSGAAADMYALAGGSPTAGSFGWPSVVDDANLHGYRSIAVPGTVAGLTHALQRYGTISLTDAIAPAIAIAESGIDVTWHTTLTIAKDLATLRRYDATAAIYLDRQGDPPATIDQFAPARIANPELGATLRRIAADGPETFYDGDLTSPIVDHLAAHGTPVTREDFSRYRVREVPGLDVGFAGHRVHTIGGGTGGTSLSQILLALDASGTLTAGPFSPEATHTLAQLFRRAFADRFAYLADPDLVDVPIDALLSPEYAGTTVARLDPAQVQPSGPGDRKSLGVAHDMPASMPDYLQGGSTTHIGVVDAAGNGVSLTQTLLSLWGSRVTVPGTGVLFNNGMMWFDPEPGRPNSIAPGKRPLSNMAPALVTRDGELVASVGSSGGRKIMNCNAQIIANLTAHGMDVHRAVEAPRIDASNIRLAVSGRLGPAIVDFLRERGHPVAVVDETLLTADFASPVVVSRDADGTITGAVDPWYFPATAMAVD